MFLSFSKRKVVWLAIELFSFVDVVVVAVTVYNLVVKTRILKRIQVKITIYILQTHSHRMRSKHVLNAYYVLFFFKRAVRIRHNLSRIRLIKENITSFTCTAKGIRTTLCAAPKSRRNLQNGVTMPSLLFGSLNNKNETVLCTITILFRRRPETGH